MRAGGGTFAQSWGGWRSIPRPARRGTKGPAIQARPARGELTGCRPLRTAPGRTDRGRAGGSRPGCRSQLAPPSPRRAQAPDRRPAASNPRASPTLAASASVSLSLDRRLTAPPSTPPKRPRTGLQRPSSAPRDHASGGQCRPRSAPALTARRPRGRPRLRTRDRHGRPRPKTPRARPCPSQNTPPARRAHARTAGGLNRAAARTLNGL